MATNKSKRLCEVDGNASQIRFIKVGFKDPQKFIAQHGSKVAKVKKFSKPLSPKSYAEMRQRMGDDKFFSLRFKQKHPHTVSNITDRSLKDLSKNISNMNSFNFNSVKKEVDGIFKRMYKKKERSKDYFKDRRWKRTEESLQAQAGNEYDYNNFDNKHNQIFSDEDFQPDIFAMEDSDLICKGSGYALYKDDENTAVYQVCFVKDRTIYGRTFYICQQGIARVIEHAQSIGSMRDVPVKDKYLMMSDLIIKENDYWHERLSINTNVNEFDTITMRVKKLMECPHCYTNRKCRTCAEDIWLSNHKKSLIEDLLIAVYQIFRVRDIPTFCCEIVRIYKALFGKAILSMELFDIIKCTFCCVYGYACHYSHELYEKVKNIVNMDSFIEFIEKIWDSSKEKLNKVKEYSKAVIQAGPELDTVNEEIRNIGASNITGDQTFIESHEGSTKVSDWMETDLFKMCTNWFAYITYLILSKDTCKHIPFLGDLMAGMVSEGKKQSGDILKFLIKSVEFALTKGRQWMEFGFKTTFYHSKSSFLNLVRRYEAAKNTFLTVRNPAVYGTDIAAFTKELQNLKNELKELCIVGTVTMKKQIQTMYAEVVMMWNDIFSDAVVMQDRKAPFSILVWGDTSVGKTYFLNIVNIALCQANGLPEGEEFIYKRNDDKRADGFKSHQHTAIFDDVGNRTPQTCPNGDPSIMDIISWQNNAAKITEQAVATDKGKIPVWIKFLLMTANTRLNLLSSYFTYPSAVSRRIHHYVHISVKEAYRTKGMLDPTKILEKNTTDLWDIRLEKFYVDENNNKAGYFKTIKEFKSIYEYIKFMIRDQKQHEANQSSRQDSINFVKNLKFNENGEIDVLKLNYSDQLQQPGSSRSLYEFPRCLEPQGMEEYLNPVTFSCKIIKTMVHVGVKTYVSIAKCKESYYDYMLNSTRKKLEYYSNCKISNSAKIRTIETIYKIKESENPLYAGMEALGDLMFPDHETITEYIKGLGLLLFAFGTYKVARYFLTKKEEKEEDNGKRTFFVPSTQGGTFSSDSSKFWVDTSNVLKDVDVGASSMFYKNNIEKFFMVVSANVILLHCKTINDKFLDIRALCLGGYTYVANLHTMKKVKIKEFEVIHDRTDVASSNYKVIGGFDKTIDFPEHDLCFFQLLSSKPKKNIYNLFARGNLSDVVLNGCYLKRNLDGSITQQKVDSVKIDEQYIGFPGSRDRTMNVFSGNVSEPTEDGDCGMPLILFTHYGPVIVGLHVAGVLSLACSLPLNTNLIDKSHLTLYPDLSPVKMKFSEVHKTLVPERAVSHPLFLAEDAVVTRYGTLSNTYMKAKTAVVRTDMAPKFEELGYVQLKTAPPMNSYKIYRNNLLEMTNKKVCVDQNILSMCVRVFFEHIKKNVSKQEFQDIGPIEDIANINGFPGVDYIDSINRNTSMGFPFNKTKKKFLFPYVTDTHPDGVIFDQEIMDEFQRIDYNARIGLIPQSVYTASQKDEPLPFEKAYNYGTRLFFGAAAPMTLLMRKYLLTIIRLFQRNRHRIGVMVGIVAQSREWETLYSYFPWKDRMMAGDFSKFDKKQDVLILQATFDIIKAIALESGQYDEVDMTAIDSIRGDVVFASINFDGDLLSFLGVLASGTPITVLVNSIAVILLYMYNFTKLAPDKSYVEQFFDLVKVVSYGDDSLASISPKCKWLDHVQMARSCESIGMKYTMAEKTADLIPFITMRDCTFLKRRFVYDTTLKCIIGPLDEKNMINSLMVWVASKNLTQDEQAYAAMQSSIREWFFHGKDAFEKMCRVYKDIYKSTYLKNIEFPTFDTICEAFESNSNPILQAQAGREYKFPTQYPEFRKFSVIGTPMSFYNAEKTILRRLLGKTSLHDDVVEKILVTVHGKCLMCDKSRTKNSLCYGHYIFVNERMLFRITCPNVYPCYVCGTFYHYDNPVCNWYPNMCTRCFMVFKCGDCCEHRLCRNHFNIFHCFPFEFNDEVVFRTDMQITRMAEMNPTWLNRYRVWLEYHNHGMWDI